MYAWNDKVFSNIQNLVRLCWLCWLGRFILRCRFIPWLLLCAVCFQLEAFCNAVYNVCATDSLFAWYSAMSALLSIKQVSNKAELIPKHLHVKITSQFVTLTPEPPRFTKCFPNLFMMACSTSVYCSLSVTKISVPCPDPLNALKCTSST